MRISSTLAVGSPTARVAAILAATLLIGDDLDRCAGIAGSRLLAADGAIVVDQSGHGDYTTVSEAVAAAIDGDTILVRPGRYVESLAIADVDLTISGDGEPDSIVLEANGADPLLVLTESDSTISGLSLTGPGSSVVVQGGSPTLTDLRFEELGRYDSAAAVMDGLVINVHATPTITHNEFAGGGWIRVLGGSAPLIEDNDLRDGPTIWLTDIGEGTIIRGNRITGAPLRAIGLYGPGAPLIEGNEITTLLAVEGAVAGIAVGEMGYSAFGTDPIIRGNTISEARTGIEIAEGAAPTIEGNDIDATESGLAFGGPGSAVITGNTICGVKSVVSVPEGMDTPSLEGNTLCDTSV